VGPAHLKPPRGPHLSGRGAWAQALAFTSITTGATASASSLVVAMRSAGHHLRSLPSSGSSPSRCLASRSA
jgi:hypothetical protein